MVKIRIKGYEFEAVAVKDSFSRRATQFRNSLTSSLLRLGISVDDIDCEIEQNAMRKMPASVSWYLDKQHLYYSHSSRTNYAENLYVVYRVIDLEIAALEEGSRSIEEFMDEFREDSDVTAKREEARSALGLGHDENDLGIIDKAYKDLAKQHHPDAENGDTETFKAINHAHKILKRELA
jgi:hypothetical protein